MKNIKKQSAAAALTVLFGLLLINSTIHAQEYHTIADVTAYHIYDKVLGPQTSDVILTGYKDRTTYHETRYVSVQTGSDASGDGSRAKPWASITHALKQITDARLSRRYALQVGAGDYVEGELFLKEYVHLYGGFDSKTWNRDILKHATRIDGKKQNRLFTASDHSKIDGFILVHGEVRGNGGAVLCNGTSPVISNNQIRENRTLGPDPWNPEFIHEIANDGGAIAAINGARPVIFNNLFIGNSTENGRGGAIGAHNRAAPRIHYNIFMENTSGTNDPMRSSDGGAIASSFYSDADIFFNLIMGNKALAKNDAGGIFSEMWSSMHIAGNIVLGNQADDDGGGIYLSGSVHHYITEHEAKVPEERYHNWVIGNIIAGNRLTGGGPPGAFRFTYFTRVSYFNNISFNNQNGLDFRRTLVNAENNTIFENVIIREGSTASLANNIIYGTLEAETEPLSMGDRVAGLEAPDVLKLSESEFKKDTHRVNVRRATYDPLTHTTTLVIRESVSGDPLLRNRIVKADDHWSVLKLASARELTIWGNHQHAKTVTIYPTFTQP